MTMKNVLMKEYQDLNAVKKGNQPQKEGYYMPHHAVIQKHAGKPSIDRKTALHLSYSRYLRNVTH